jgi:predicted nucleic acid-binding protein
LFYVDTSVAVKLVLTERGSAAARRWLERRSDAACSSDLLRVELQRAVRREAPDRMDQARAVLDSLLLMRISTETYERAARLGPDGLRSLDALHLACALELGVELEGVVTYDDRLAEAAKANGIGVISPA